MTDSCHYETTESNLIKILGASMPELFPEMLPMESTFPFNGCYQDT